MIQHGPLPNDVEAHNVCMLTSLLLQQEGIHVSRLYQPPLARRSPPHFDMISIRAGLPLLLSAQVWQATESVATPEHWGPLSTCAQQSG